MCDKNLIYLTSIDYLIDDDINSWSTLSINPITISNGFLAFNQTNDSVFEKSLGIALSSKDRFLLSFNYLFDNITTTSNAIFRVIVKTSSDVFLDEVFDVGDVEKGKKGFYERIIKYNLDSDQEIKLSLQVVEGFDFLFGLFDLNFANYNYCSDNIKTYFILDSLFEDSLLATSGGIKLNSYKIDDVETLTLDFEQDTSQIGGTPLNEWLYANSTVDGTNRVQDVTTPNTFNPFFNELKLDFESNDSFYSGKAIGTINGKDYGLGVLNIGIDKPIILNGNQEEKKSSFFLFIDYTKNLEVKFDVIINNSNENLYVDYEYLKSYTLKWDASKCESSFFYEIDGVVYNQDVNGFLNGITGIVDL